MSSAKSSCFSRQAKHNKVKGMTIKKLLELVDVRDPRGGGGRRKHVFKEILAIAILAKLSGAQTFNEMEDFGKCRREWLATFLKLPHGIPSHDTFNRAIRSTPAEEFEGCFQTWAEALRLQAVGAPQRIVAVDGKALRRAGCTGKAPVIVGAWDERAGIALGQEQVEEKSNAITAVPRLLERLDLRGAVVTMDAMGCQKATAGLIRSRGGDYMLALKGNQGLAYEEMRVFMEDAIANTPQRLAFHETTDKGHGRLETRRCWQSADLDGFADRSLWPGLQSVCMLESERSVGGTTTTERRLFLCSMMPDAPKAMETGRGHWGIENRLHHRLDVQLGEDLSRARAGNAPRNLALIRRTVLNVFGRDKQNRGLRRCQKIADWKPRLPGDHALRQRLISGTAR